jgi:hypothetical protein
MSFINIDIKTIHESQPSLCIPRVFNNINEARIRQVFDELALGKIRRIDIIERTNEKGDSFKRVYIHFEKWFWNDDAQAARKKLVSDKEIKIVYDNPWFWKVSASKWTNNSNTLTKQQERQPRPRAHIDFGDELPMDQQTHDEFGRDLSLKKKSENNKFNKRETRPITPSLMRKSGFVKSNEKRLPCSPSSSPPRIRTEKAINCEDITSEEKTEF